MKRNLIACFMVAALLLFCACSAAPAPAEPNGSGAPAQTAPGEEPWPAPQATGAPTYPWPDGEGVDPGAAEDSRYSRNNESYLEIDANREVPTDAKSLITFSLKVDTAAYANVQRYIESGQRPPRDAVRTEELINYFSYDSAPVFTAGDPFGIYTEVGPSPLDPEKYMVLVRVKARDLPQEQLPPSSFTFLIDTSGSMNSYDKLPLLQEAFSLLVEQLGAEDRVSIVTYAGSSQVVLDGATGNEKNTILRAIKRLKAGGSTAGAQGIQTAYELAYKNFFPGGNNRVLLATDGDFNVGISNVEELNRFIAEKRQSNIYLSVLGFGTGNIRDDIMESLAKNGNGNYSYIYNAETAHKVLVEELAGNLFAIADDVKAQVEFNPANVASYRLIGYENRMLADTDFADDRKDAGEIGVGTDVVALFEITLAQPEGAPTLKYGDSPRVYSGNVQAGAAGEFADELLEVRIRYKHPGQSTSNLILRPVTFADMTGYNSSDYTFACSVAAFGELLRGSEYAGGTSLEQILRMAQGSLGQDTAGHRAAHLRLLEQYGQQLRW